MSDSYRDYIVGVHSLYNKYEQDWQLARDSYFGGVEIRDGKYLKAYAVDMNTPAETVNTYSTDSNGYVKKSKARVENVSTKAEAHRGEDTVDGGTFYAEKLNNTPYLNYLRLITAEYNSILFKNPPVRSVGEQPDMDEFLNNVNGEEDNINEFMATVDLYSFIYGTAWISCVKPIGSDIPKWKIHTPLDVTNWHYGYDGRGDLNLKSIVIKLHEDAEETVYRYMTPESIETVWVGEEDDYVPDVADSNLIKEDGYWRVIEENELGYIPVVPVYQGLKIYNGIGATPSFDLAQIQRSVYSDMAEIYSVISYGAHGSLIVDEATDSLNDGAISAEPGSVVRVPAGLGEAPNYVYEFVTPALTAVTEIRELIEQKITKMTEIAMIRSDDLIKSSRSGEQLEQYDSKLEAFVRRKAQNLENAESKLFNIWYDWTNTQKPEEFSVSYNRQYSKKALQHEVAEIDSLLRTYTEYQNVFYNKDYTIQDYPTEQEAESVANSLGGSGYHAHTREDGLETFMPFNTHLEYEQAVNATMKGGEDAGFVEEMRDKLRKRLSQLVESSTTDNGL